MFERIKKFAKRQADKVKSAVAFKKAQVSAVA